MIALAEAVIPIIRLLVAVATRSGTPMTRCITGTLTMPPPTPSSAETTPGERRADDARDRAGSLGRTRVELGPDRRRAVPTEARRAGGASGVAASSATGSARPRARAIVTAT